MSNVNTRQSCTSHKCCLSDTLQTIRQKYCCHILPICESLLSYLLDIDWQLYFFPACVAEEDFRSVGIVQDTVLGYEMLAAAIQLGEG